MFRRAFYLVLLVVSVVVAGCDSKPETVPTDPESVEKLKELQKQGNQGEKVRNQGEKKK